MRRCLLLLLSSLAEADVSTAKDLPGNESFVEAPMKKGWFQLPGGYELTFVEDHRAEVDGFIMRKNGVRTRFDSRELHAPNFSIERLNAVRLGSRGTLEAELRGSDFYGNDQSAARTTLSRVTSRYHEATKEFPRAIALDPSLASARVAEARAQLKSGDHNGAIETLVGALAVPAFYMEALQDPEVAPLLDEDRIKRQLPRDGDAQLGDVSWSPWLGRVAWFEDYDSDSEEPEQDFVVQTLGGHVDGRFGVDAKRVGRYLHDLGFQAARRAAITRTCDDEKSDLGAWARALRKLGIPRARLVGDEVFVGEEKLMRVEGCDVLSWTMGYLPGPRVVYGLTFPRGPCTVGGAPAAHAWLELHPLSPGTHPGTP